MNKPVSRFGGMRLDSRSTKTRVEEMTASGVDPDKIAHRLKCSLSYVYEVRAQLRAASLALPNAPLRADHEAHVDAVMAQGGFSALSERRTPKGEPYACLPLLWPRVA